LRRGRLWFEVSLDKKISAIPHLNGKKLGIVASAYYPSDGGINKIK
jgi:hypothetical protein